ncbi:MAG: DCC1-like thiol-disulfide oxidoreductase family protein [Bacteroidota bacterium]
MMNNLWNSIKKSWFAPVDPKRLAILRIATGSFCLWYLLSRFDMLQRMTQNTDAFEAIGILSWMEKPLNEIMFWWISIAMIILNICYILGWRFKLTGPVFAISALLFFTYRNSWSMIYHNRNALVLHIIILGFVAAADAWSVDAWRNQQNKRRSTDAHWRYGWPIMLVCAVTVGSYFLSGVAKIAGDLAWEWANGSAMRSQIAVDAIRKSILGAETAPFFNVIYKHKWLFLLMGLFTFIVELGAPLALYKKRWGKLWAFLTWCMHWGIYFIMGITFRYQMTGLIFLSFFAPEKSFTNARKKVANKTDGSLAPSTTHDLSPIILFDGVCNLCNGWVRFVMRNERKREFRFASLQSDTAEKMLRPFTVKNNMGSIVLIEGDILYEKSEAVLLILGKLKHLWPMLSAFIIVPKLIRDSIYNFIAKHRYGWFGRQQSCGLVDPEDKVRMIES